MEFWLCLGEGGRDLVETKFQGVEINGGEKKKNFTCKINCNFLRECDLFFHALN